jgi:pilus assembly protein CpaB
MLRKSTEVPETGTRTILRDVNVFSVDGTTERDVDEKGQARALSTVSLLLKPQQAEAVMLASELGRLSLTLRRPDDETEAATEGLTISSLLGNASESANEKKNGGGLTGWLNGLTSQATPPPATTVPLPDTTTPEKPKWEMIILGPTNYQNFYWTDEKELPKEGVFGTPTNAPGGLFAPAATVPVSSTTDATVTPPDAESEEATASDRTTSTRFGTKKSPERESTEEVEEEGDESPE